MTKNTFAKYWLCAAIPVIILAALTVTPLLTIMLGQEVRIKTLPVDPRDVFRGDYVRLNYEINEIPSGQYPEVFNDQEKWGRLQDKALYVILKKEKDYYIVDRAVEEKPENGLYVKGHFQWGVWAQTANYKGDENLKGIRVAYNLDQFFVPENTGKSLEFLSQRGQLIAVIKVWKGFSTLVRIEPQ